MEKLIFTAAEGEEAAELYILDQAKLQGHTYLLVTDSEDGDGNAMILRENDQTQGKETLYDIVEDDREIDSVLVLFKDTLEELGILIEEDEEA